MGLAGQTKTTETTYRKTNNIMTLYESDQGGTYIIPIVDELFL